MLKFPSEGWIRAFKEELNKNEDYAEAAKDWEGNFLFIVTPDEKLDEETIFYVDLWHGKCRDVQVVSSRDEKVTEFVYEGSYGNWLRLINGEIDPIKGILMRKFKLEGKMSTIMRYTRAASELVKTASRVPTEFV